MTLPRKSAIAYIDGSGNSGRIQACATAIYVDGEDGCHEHTSLLPGHTTNNVGEYSGLLLAIRVAKELNVEVLRVRSDSRLIVEQVQGKWRCKNDLLKKYRDRVWDEAQEFHKIEIEWIPREENHQADGLCRLAIKEFEKKSKKSSKSIAHL